MASITSPNLLDVQGHPELETLQEHDPFKHVFYFPHYGNEGRPNLFPTMLFRDWEGAGNPS